MMQVSSKAGEQQHSAAPQIEHQRRRECSPQVFCSILTRSLGPQGTLTVTREVAGALAHSINATQDCEILYHAIPCSTTQGNITICRANLTQCIVVLWTPFLDAVASLRPGMTGQNRRIQGALPENPGCITGESRVHCRRIH